MKITALIARYLLGLIFLVFGLNGFLHFLPMPPMAGTAGQFMTALAVSNYTILIFSLEVISAVLLIVNLYVPLGLTLLAPVIVNIFFFHVLMAPAGVPLAVIVVLLWILTALSVRSAFAGILQQKVYVSSAGPRL